MAHKATQQLKKAEVAGLITFGDPNRVWNDIPLPESIPKENFKPICIEGELPDPLCADLSKGYQFPHSVDAIMAPFEAHPKPTVGKQQIDAIKQLLLDFFKQLPHVWAKAFKDLQSPGRIRLALTPQHFTYGNNIKEYDVGTFVANLPAVQEALKKGKLQESS